MTEEEMKAFYDVFRGYEDAHGRSNLKGTIRQDGKQEAKSQTVKQPVRPSDVRNHLSGGAYGIGVVPLKKDSSISFGIIDIDSYQGFDVAAFSRSVSETGLPVVVFRSKSGGAHVYVFFQQPVAAREARPLLVALAEQLGFKGCEVFPKQTSRRSAQDIGNWINLPYYNAHETDRYCLKNGVKLGFFEFIPYVQEMRTTLDELRKHISVPINTEEMISTPIAEVVAGGDATSLAPVSSAAGRNDYLFRQGCRLRYYGYPDKVIAALLNYLNLHCTEANNPNFKNGPLPVAEVESIYASVMKYKGGLPPAQDMGAEEAMDMMNEKFAIVMESGKTHVIYAEHDDALKRAKLNRSSFADIKNYYKDPVFLGYNDDEPIYAPLGQWWLSQPIARRYEQVVFRPATDVQNAYNLWRGFAVVSKAGSCELFKKHLLDNICSGNAVYYEYIMNWFARMIQLPGLPGEVALVFRGGRGTGKSILIRIVGRILGQHFLQISNARHMVGNFNAHLQDVVLLFADEAFWAGDKGGESVLKTLVTEVTILIEPKGVDPYAAPSCLHIVLASNNDWVVPAGADERRFFVLDVGEQRKQDQAYFAALVAEAEKGGYEALLHELQQRDISQFNFRVVPPSGALAEQKIRSLSPEHLWIYEKLADGRLLENHDGWQNIIAKTDLQSDYFQQGKDRGINHRAAATMIGMMLSKLFPGLQDKRTSDGRYYIFPDLDECRRDFERYMKTEIVWPAEADETEYIEELY